MYNDEAKLKKFKKKKNSNKNSNNRKHPVASGFRRKIFLDF